MVSLFKNPILGRIEEVLRTKALEEARVKVEALDPATVKDKEKAIASEAKQVYKTLLAEEQPKAKMALNEFGKIDEGKTEEALEKALSQTSPEWYSVEMSPERIPPEVLAVPQKVVSAYTAQVLAEILAPRIEFSAMLPEVREVFAREAVRRHLPALLSYAKREKWKIEINPPYHDKLSVVDLIRDDWYFLGDEQEASRVDIVVLSTHDARWWRKQNRDVDFRPQGRRFTNDHLLKWGLKEFDLASLKN